MRGMSVGGDGSVGVDPTSRSIASRSRNFIESPMSRSDSIVSAILGSFPFSFWASGSIRGRQNMTSGEVFVPRTRLFRAAARSARPVRKRLLSNSLCASGEHAPLTDVGPSLSESMR